MKQNPAGTILNYNVPTPAQLSGDFSNAWSFAYSTLCCNQPAGATATSVPVADFDPNGVNCSKLIPKPDIAPNAGNGWNNYQCVSQVPQNRLEATGKVDYAIGDNRKLTGSYTWQIENDQHPVGIWRRHPGLCCTRLMLSRTQPR